VRNHQCQQPHCPRHQVSFPLSSSSSSSSSSSFPSPLFYKWTMESPLFLSQTNADLDQNGWARFDVVFLENDMLGRHRHTSFLGQSWPNSFRLTLAQFLLGRYRPNQNRLNPHNWVEPIPIDLIIIIYNILLYIKLKKIQKISKIFSKNFVIFFHDFSYLFYLILVCIFYTIKI